MVNVQELQHQEIVHLKYVVKQLVHYHKLLVKHILQNVDIIMLIKNVIHIQLVNH